MDIEDILDAIRNSRVRITDHADEEAVNDELTFGEIYFYMMHREILEDYPNDKPYPSCLVMGKKSQVSQFTVSGPVIQAMDGR